LTVSLPTVVILYNTTGMPHLTGDLMSENLHHWANIVSHLGLHSVSMQ